MFRQTLTMLCGVSLISAAGCVHHPDLNAPQEELTQYVRPLVGTAGFGNTYPGSQIPFGGIQMSPDTDFDDYDVAAGYKYDHPTLLGFSLTHLSGTGIPDLGDFLFMPGWVRSGSIPGHMKIPMRGTGRAILTTGNGPRRTITGSICSITARRPK